MILSKPSHTILTPLDSAAILARLEKAGRTCYKSEGRIKDGSAETFIGAILQRGHESVIEHESISVRFICDRGVSHELVRHRIASYSQSSTRYCDYNKGQVEFIIPSWSLIPEGEYAGIDSMPLLSGSDAIWFTAVWICENNYKRLRLLGWKPEQARSVLPNSLKTEIVMTANLREWRHFFKLRTARAAHPQMRELVAPLLVELQGVLPVIFDSIKIDDQR